MKKCDACRTEIDNMAKVCPYCQSEQDTSGMSFWGFMLVIFLICAAIFG